MRLQFDLTRLIMFDLDKLVRENIRNLKPYTSARDEYTGAQGVFLDANENPFGRLNRYPDPYQKAVKQRLSEIKGAPSENIFIGNGSDEVIDLVYRIFCEPGKDKVLTFAPTYGMYAVSAAVNDIELIELPLSAEFQLDLEQLGPVFNDDQLKLIFLCSPNNPTANSMDRSAIEYILKSFNGIVLIDEAYIDFSEEPSWISVLKQYPNLIVMQTFSKAWGLAAARLGVAYADSGIIDLLNKVKPPYNVSKPNQDEAMQAFEQLDQVKETIREILLQRTWLIDELGSITSVKKIYPSDANFLLVEVINANEIYEQLIKEKVIVRNRHGLVQNCLRITVGSKDENRALIKSLKEIDL